MKRQRRTLYRDRPELAEAGLEATRRAEASVSEEVSPPALAPFGTDDQGADDVVGG